MVLINVSVSSLDYHFFLTFEFLIASVKTVIPLFSTCELRKLCSFARHESGNAFPKFIDSEFFLGGEGGSENLKIGTSIVTEDKNFTLPSSVGVLLIIANLTQYK